MAKKRKAKVQAPRIRGTYYLSLAGVEADEIRTLILRRRLQILVHSCIYYELDDNLIPDSTWSAWATELAELQEKYPTIASRVDYHEAFKGFDGSTGFNLPLRSPEIMGKAQYLLKLHKEKNDVSIGHKTRRADPDPNVIRLSFPQ